MASSIDYPQSNIVSGNGKRHPFSAEMETARRVQRGLFPHRLPHGDAWDFAVLCRPARIVAGDYCDLFEAGTDRCVLAVGDVAGKGLGPSLVMAGLHALIHSRFEQGVTELAMLVAKLNRYLCESTPDDMFVTLFLSYIDLQSGELHYVNCGHPPPKLIRNGEKAPIRLKAGGMLLGVSESACFEVGRFILRSGDALVSFSDGLTDASDHGGHMFQEDVLQTVLESADTNRASEILAQVIEAVDRFTKGADQPDDISVAVVQRQR